jgi:hypothetical protein
MNVWGMQVGHGRVGSIASLMVMKTSPESDWSLEGCFSIVVGDSRAGCDDASFTQESNLRIKIIVDISRECRLFYALSGHEAYVTSGRRKYCTGEVCLRLSN